MTDSMPKSHSVMRSHTIRALGRERGAVLIFALIILLVMTVLAISGIGNSALEQRMAGNYSQQITAFEAAEQGLRVAEEWLFKNLDPNSPVRDADANNWENWFKATDVSEGGGIYSTRESHPTGAKVCGISDCVFDPSDEDQWCTAEGCALSKGYVTLGDELRGDTLSPIGQNVAKEPRFIIEATGPTGLESRSIVLGKKSSSASGQSFRVTVIGWGQDGTSRHVVQSHVVLTL
jgi:type IV pilus assembly protein PilX